MPHVIDPNQDYRATSGRYMTVAARLKPDVTLAQAQVEMSAIARQLELERPDFNKNWGVNLVPLYEQIVGDVRLVLIVLLAAVGFVLLIACVNMANLLLARAAMRQREIAVRTALGAGRRRLVKQLITESLLLAALGGVLGLLLAGWGVQTLVALAPPALPRLSEIGIHPAVFAFTALASLATGILFGLVPAIEVSRANLNDALKSGGRSATGDVRRHRMRSLLVVSETALALVLMIGAGLLIRSFGRLGTVDPGFNPEHLLTLRVELTGSRYQQDSQVVSFFQQAVERAGHLPGVRSAGAINFLPLTGLDSATGFTIFGQPAPRPGEHPVTGVRVVDPGYFRTMGIPLLSGRSFTARDTKTSSRVLIISATLARRFFPNEDPIGKKLIIQWDDSIPDEIVGVVGDVLHDGLDTQPWPIIYWPHARMPYNFMTLVMRTQSDPMALAAATTHQILGFDPDQPVADVRAMTDVVGESVSRQRFNMLLFTVLAGVALALAAAGIYGVVAYGVSERTHEIGIRLALGAARNKVMGMVLAQGLALALAGVAFGLGGAFLLTRLMKSLLFGVTATDPVTYLGLSLVLVLVALLACYAPAWRATKVDPMVSLRYE
jgi:putative ABC transport system permease protein